jgi:hypothetical protein
MRRFVLPGLLAALTMGLLAASGEAGSGGAWSGHVGFGGARSASPFYSPPLGQLQNEAWGRYLRHQYLSNSPPPQFAPPPPVAPRHPNWAWVDPSWQWNGFRWVWVPGYWVSRP